MDRLVSWRGRAEGAPAPPAVPLDRILAVTAAPPSLPDVTLAFVLSEAFTLKAALKDALPQLATLLAQDGNASSTLDTGS